MKKYIKEICIFGFGYSCVIAFCLYGPLLQVFDTKDTFTNTIIALVAFIIAFLNPYINKFNKSLVIKLFILAELLLFLSFEFSIIDKIAIFIFAFVIATFCRSFTLHVLDKVDVEASEIVFSFSFLIAFSVLYLINIFKPILNSNVGLGIIMLLGIIAAYFYKIGINEESIDKQNEKKLNSHVIIPLISLYLIYIGGGVSYAGIYPYLEKFYYIDRYYNVLPLVIFMPIAGILGKKYGNLINLFLGIIFLSIAFTFFLLPLSIYNYFFIQTFLQIGWAFTNVFGFSYSWRLANNYKNYYVFGYGILFILLGVTSGSVIANFIVVNNYSIIYFGPITFIPLIISLVFQFFYSDIKTNYNIKDNPNSINLLEFDSFNNLDILSELTTREREIIYYYYNSETAVRIADKLHISPNTVRSHIKNSYSKLGITKRDELKDLISKKL